jgi:predicted RNase H-like HicB family nuclease
MRYMVVIEEAIQFHLEDMRDGGHQIPAPA